MITLPVLLLTAALSAPSDTVLLDFTADWCAPCRVVAPTVQRLEDEGYPVRRINVDQHPELVRQYGIEGVPCFILVAGGREVDRVMAAASYDRLVRMFDKAGYRLAVETSEVVRGQSPDSQASPIGIPMDHYAAAASTAATDTAPSAAAASGASMNAVEQAGLAASVRIKVMDEGGHSFGTGTIIDTHGDEALIVTCGHLFRESAGKGQISVELLGGEPSEPIPAQLIEYHADARDIALLAIRPGRPVTPMRVAATKEGVAPGAPVFSIGCNHGGEPTVIRSHITSIDRYLNAPNIEVAGMPVLGRSGGGLFTKDGRLIGVCNAADEVDNEGIYAGLASLHWQLDRIGLSRVYQPGAAPTPASDAATASGVEVAADISNLPARGAEVTIGAPAAGNEETDVRAAVAEAAISVSSGASAQELLTALRDGDEVICVIRRRDQREARAVVLDGSSRELLSRLAREIQSDVVPQSIETATRAVQSLGNIAMPQ